MRTDYNKLVRDRIPEIIAHTGRRYEVRVASPAEARILLRAKLIEEAQEAAASHEDDLIKELADVLEVVDALAAAYGLDREALLATQAQRRQDRGGFAQRLVLLWTDATPLNATRGAES